MPSTTRSDHGREGEGTDARVEAMSFIAFSESLSSLMSRRIHLSERKDWDMYSSSSVSRGIGSCGAQVVVSVDR